jgi:DNA-binding HxlR family transcriptional regulator
VRDLLVGPRRFTDLRKGLPKIPTNVLADRLKEFERDGIVRRRLLPRPAAATVYELTAYGAQLESAVMQLGIWGAQSLGEPGLRPEEIVTPDSMTIALRSTFVPAAAKGQHVIFELRMGPRIVLQARVDDGTIRVSEGRALTPDLVIEAGPALKSVLARELTPDAALQQGLIRVEGQPKMLDTFAQMFYIPSHRETAQA